jgi:Flp pilus assembly CpaF family ATPase
MTTATEETLLRHAAPLLPYFRDPEVTAIYRNPDGSLWTTSSGCRRVRVGELPAATAESFLNALASLQGVPFTSLSPSLAADLPAGEVFWGSRLQAFRAPTTAGVSFVIRKPARKLLTLSDLVRLGSVSEEARELLTRALLGRKNLLIAGGTDSGKTTVAGALLDALAELQPDHRIVLIEDTPEIRLPSADVLALRTSAQKDHRHLVLESLRSDPDRIVFGEVRGAEAFELLNAWSTGHPGGLTTFHATDPVGALHRMDRLAQLAAPGSSQGYLVASAIDLVLLVEKVGPTRALASIHEVLGFVPPQTFDVRPLLGDPR